MTRAFTLTLFISVACSGRACTETRAPSALECPDCNVVLITLTNVRKDHLGIYGYPRATSPHIDNFFAHGFVLDNAMSTASWTLPVAASLYTGTFPTTHGVLTRTADTQLDDDAVTLAELFTNAGYQTAAFTGGGDYRQDFKLDQGFGTYVDLANASTLGLGPQLSSAHQSFLGYADIERTTLAAIEWLKQHRNDKFFLHLQGYDAHCPFDPPPPFDRQFDPEYDGGLDFGDCLWTFGRTVPVTRDGLRVWPVRTQRQQEVLLSDRDVHHLIARYDGEIARADASLAGLFAVIDALGLTSKTLVILLSEHGDLFGEHGRFMRGGPVRGTFYEPVLNVPLLVRHPNLARLQAVPALAQPTDLLPTLVDALGLADARASLREGKSLLPALETGGEVHDSAVAGTRHVSCDNAFFTATSVIEAVRTGDWKLIREAVYDADSGSRSELRYQLFHLGNDPAELDNRYYDEPERAQRLEKELRRRLGPDPYGDSAPRCPTATEQ